MTRRKRQSKRGMPRFTCSICRYNLQVARRPNHWQETEEGKLLCAQCAEVYPDGEGKAKVGRISRKTTRKEKAVSSHGQLFEPGEAYAMPGYTIRDITFGTEGAAHPYTAYPHKEGWLVRIVRYGG